MGMMGQPWDNVVQAITVIEKNLLAKSFSEEGRETLRKEKSVERKPKKRRMLNYVSEVFVTIDRDKYEKSENSSTE